MLNYIWLALILLGVVIGGFSHRMKEVADGAVAGAGSAVTLAIGLIGVMALWLGVMRLAERAGLVQALARLLQPVLRRIFPDVPAEHPAMGSMVLNIAANMLGLSNAATPLGLRAMRDLETLNRVPGTATNAMCTFLTINTGSVQLVPITVIAVLAANGSQNPAAIIGTALLASIVVSAIGISAVKFFERLPMFSLPGAMEPGAMEPGPTEPGTFRSRGALDLKVQGSESKVQGSDSRVQGPASHDEASTLVAVAPPREVSPLGRLALTAFALCCVWFLVLIAFPEWFGRAPLADQAGQGPLVRSVNALSLLAIPALLAFFPLYAGLRGLAVYEEFVEGAKEGFSVAVRIIPYLVAMLVAIGMFRGGGGIDLLTRWLKPTLDLVGFPTELLPLALMRSLSGSGSLGIFTDLVKTLGPDHLITQMAATIYGSSETTFYVIAVYFGSVGVQRTRHAVPAGLVADVAGIIASIIICRLILG